MVKISAICSNFLEDVAAAYHQFLEKSLDKISDKFRGLVFFTVQKIYRPKDYVLDINIRKEHSGASSYAESADLNRAFQNAEIKLKRCENKDLPGCFYKLSRLEKAFTDGENTYAIFENECGNSGKVLSLHLVGLYEKQGEKVSNLLGELGLPFFITRDMIH